MTLDKLTHKLTMFLTGKENQLGNKINFFHIATKIDTRQQHIGYFHCVHTMHRTKEW